MDLGSIAVVIWFVAGLFWLLRAAVRENVAIFFASVAFLALGAYIFAPAP